MTFPVPYPADTRAKGWRFEVDTEKVKASDTWLRAKRGDIRGALLLLWAESWQQTPCGSLPNDDELIALLIDMAPATFAKNRSILMRGWRLADDGRLYHETITARVLDMLAKRAKDAKRAADRRARHADAEGSPDGVAGASRVTPGGVLPKSDTKHQAPSTSEPTGSGKPPRKRDAAPVPDRPEGVSEQTWADWLQLRKGKRAAVTATVLAEAATEAAKAGLTLDRFLAIWCVRGSQGLQADWLKPSERGNAPAPTGETVYQKAMRERMQQIAPGVAAKAPATNVIELEAVDVAARRLG